MRPLVRAQTLGAAALLVGAQRLDPSAGTIFALLLRVLYGAGCTVAREILLRTLWHGQAETRQRANLRQALYKLRQMGVQIGLEGDVVTLDALQIAPVFATHRTGPRFEQDVTLGHEPFGLFLPGFRTGWAEYDEWLDVVRESVHADVRRVLVEQLRNRRARADWMGADAIARWLLQFDPLNEEATLTTAECSALNGSKAEAVAMLDRYLAELGPDAGDLRLQATLLRRRISEPHGKQRVSFAPTERHFIGREELMAELTLAMRRAKWHDGSATLLHGPPGMGKTRVTQELAKVAVLEGFRVVSVSCRESDQQRPLSVFLELVPELLEMPGAMGCSPESMAVLRRLVQFHSPDESETFNASVSQHERRDEHRPVSQTSIRRSILDVLAAISHEQPLLVVIDDAHLQDESSADVVLELAQQVISTRVFLLITCRSGIAPDSLPYRVGNRVALRPVPPLAGMASQTLALAVGNDFAACPDEALLQWFASASEGSPLFLRALVHHWVETGDAGGVPPTLTGVLTQRLRELSADARRILEAVSVMGAFATVDMLQLVLELPLPRAIAALAELHNKGALTRTSSEVVEIHDMLASTVRTTLSPIVRSTISRHVSRALVNQFEATRDPELLLAALRNLKASDSRAEAAALIRSHLTDLASAGRPTEALATLDWAAHGSASLSANPQVRSARMRLELDAGEFGRAVALWTRGLSLPAVSSSLLNESADDALTHVDSAFRADALVDPNELASYCDRVCAQATLDAGVRLRAAEIGLIVASNTCDAEIARQLHDSARHIPLSTIHHTALSRVLLIYHTLFGDKAIAFDAATTAMKNARDLASSSGKYKELSRAAFSLRIVGSADAALFAFVEAFEVSQQLDSPRLGQYPAWQCAAILRDQGRTDDANRWEEILFRLVEEDEDKCSSSFVIGHACRIAIDQGDSERSASLLEEYRVSLPRLPHVKAAAFGDALRLGAMLIDPALQPDIDLISVAEARHRVVSTFGTSDFLSSVLIEAKRRTQSREEAQDFATRYLNTQRREPGSIAQCLRSATAKLAD